MNDEDKKFNQDTQRESTASLESQVAAMSTSLDDLRAQITDFPRRWAVQTTQRLTRAEHPPFYYGGTLVIQATPWAIGALPLAQQPVYSVVGKDSLVRVRGSAPLNCEIGSLRRGPAYITQILRLREMSVRHPTKRDGESPSS